VFAALALTLDQHFDGFLADFEQNAARIFDYHDGRPNLGDASQLSVAGRIARLVAEDDLEHGRRRGVR
jgi:hypothetical protein